MRRFVMTAFLPVLVSLSSFAQRQPCSVTVNLAGGQQPPYDHTLSWDPVPGADSYRVTETLLVNARLRMVQLRPDPNLRALLRRGIVPVAGSTRGANGSNCSTSTASSSERLLREKLRRSTEAQVCCHGI